MTDIFKNISSSTPINCKEYYTQEREIVKQYIHDNDLEGKYYLAVVQLGEEGESTAYINGKKKDLEYIGCSLKVFNINTSKSGYIQEAYQTIHKLNNDFNCAGIMVEIDRDIVKRMNPVALKSIYNMINPKLDIDGLNEYTDFKPCTAEGTISLLKNFLKVDLKGKRVTVLGRSKLVGKPIIDMLIEESATVVCCNSYTPSWELSDLLYNSDIVISAVGKPRLINQDDFCFQDNYIIIDIGTTFMNGKLIGDVDEETYEQDWLKCLYTPVPGGMGLVTRATVLTHFLFGIQYRENMSKKMRDNNVLEKLSLNGAKLTLSENGNFVVIPDKNKENEVKRMKVSNNE